MKVTSRRVLHLHLISSCRSRTGPGPGPETHKEVSSHDNVEEKRSSCCAVWNKRGRPARPTHPSHPAWAPAPQGGAASCFPPKWKEPGSTEPLLTRTGLARTREPLPACGDSWLHSKREGRCCSRISGVFRRICGISGQRSNTGSEPRVHQLSHTAANSCCAEAEERKMGPDRTGPFWTVQPGEGAEETGPTQTSEGPSPDNSS